ncbi:MAG: AAA family ATPase [Verrucomicrobiota bacterium]|jgi:AAA+ superfamily predicted ATPase
MSQPDHISQLREAVALSPGNIPLRQALADALVSSGRHAEAEAEYRAALALAPDQPGLKLGLARAFHQQGKRSHTLVVLEDLVTLASAPARAHVLYARLLASMGEVEQAVVQYRKGIAKDPEAADPEFAQKMGIRPEPEPEDKEGDEEDDGFPSGDLFDVEEGRVRSHSTEGDAGLDDVVVERPRITFADVGGMDALKEEIQLKIVHPITHADLYKAYGKSAGGGILLYGPPGCGKTHLARATAGEIKAGFISIGIHDVLDMWLGNSERNLHHLFQQARRNKPCVLFFDEVDALGASRTDMKTSGGRHLINQFLNELDGVQSSNEGVLVLGATNAPWHLDSAFRRPGRFDRILFVPPPDAPARAAILRILLVGKPQDDLDAEAIAAKCEGFSGADLKAVVDQAVEAKLRDAMRSGTPQPLRTKDLLAVVSKLKPTTREWFATARNYALYANQGGAYDDILRYLKL